MSDPAYTCAQYNSGHQYLLKSKDRFDAESFIDSQPGAMKINNTLYRPIPTVSSGGVSFDNSSKSAKQLVRQEKVIGSIVSVANLIFYCQTEICRLTL